MGILIRATGDPIAQSRSIGMARLRHIGRQAARPEQAGAERNGRQQNGGQGFGPPFRNGEDDGK